MTDNFDLRKYLVENKVTTNSRMLNEEAETYDVGYYGERYNEAEEQFIFPAMLDASEWMVSQGIAPELAYEIEYDGLEGAWQVIQDKTGKDYPLICTFKIKDKWVSEEKAYDLGDGKVAIVEDYTNTFMVVPKAAFEKFKQAVTSQNESMHSKQPRRKPVKNKVTTNSRMLREAEEISPEQAVNQAMKVLPKLEKSTEFDKLASQVVQDPKLMQQLEKALSQAGISMNENIDQLDTGDLKALALNLAKKGMQMNEEEDDGTAVGAGFLAFAAGGTLAANFSAAIAAAVPVLGTLFAGPAVAGAIAGVALYALARKVYQKAQQKSGSQQDPNYLKNKFKDAGFNVS